MCKFEIKKEDCLCIGTLIKTYGRKGEFILRSDSRIPDSITGLKSVFLEIDGQLVPFFITDDGIDIRSDTSAVILFDDILSGSRINKMLDSKVYMPHSHSPGVVSEDPEHSEIVGFDVIDKNHGNIGKIARIMTIPGNPVLKVIKGNKEILIPVTGTIIRSVDEENRKVVIEAPEGLIELYI